MKKNVIQRYDVILWKYEYETRPKQHGAAFAVFAGFKETTFKILICSTPFNNCSLFSHSDICVLNTICCTMVLSDTYSTE
jgi:hypothetical protein